MGSRIDAGTERIDKVKAVIFERSDIVAEQRQHQRFLRSQYLESAEKDPAEGDDQHTKDHDQRKKDLERQVGRRTAQMIKCDAADHDTKDSHCVHQQEAKQHGEPVLFGLHDFFFYIFFLHRKPPFLCPAVPFANAG